MSEAITFEMRAPVDGLKADLQQGVQAVRQMATQVSAQRIKLNAGLDAESFFKELRALRPPPVKVQASLESWDLKAKLAAMAPASTGGGQAGGAAGGGAIQAFASLEVANKVTGVVRDFATAMHEVAIEGKSGAEALTNFARRLPVIGNLVSAADALLDVAEDKIGGKDNAGRSNRERDMREGQSRADSDRADAVQAQRIDAQTAQMERDNNVAAVRGEDERAAARIEAERQTATDKLKSEMEMALPDKRAALEQQQIQVDRTAERKQKELRESMERDAWVRQADAEAILNPDKSAGERRKLEVDYRNKISMASPERAIELQATRDAHLKKFDADLVAEQAKKAEEKLDAERAENEKANEDRYERDTKWAEQKADEQDRTEKEAMRAEEKRNEKSREGLAKWNEQFEVDGGGRGRGGSSEAVSASTTSFAVEGSTMIGIQREGNSFLKKMAAHLEQIEKNKVKVF